MDKERRRARWNKKRKSKQRSKFRNFKRNQKKLEQHEPIEALEDWQFESDDYLLDTHDDLSYND